MSVSSTDSTEIRIAGIARDSIVDGDYREEERDLTLHFRGSRNQRVIDLAATRATGQLTLRYTEE